MSYKGSYHRQWSIVAGLALLATLYWGYPSIKNFSFFQKNQLRSIPGAESDAYQILALPEIKTQYESGVQAMRVRMEEWIDALLANGYTPMRLSEVRARLQRGQKLPPRTIVLALRSGSQKTNKIALPLFEKRRVPAVLITHERSMQSQDRRYITFHDARKMKATGLWDILYEDPKGRWRLEHNLGRSLSLGGRENQLWAENAGALSVNRGIPEGRLQALWVLSDWLAPELVSRLKVETPVEKSPTRLVLGKIQNREWGITTSTDVPGAAQRFDIAAPLHRRGIKHYWLATRGASAYHLKADVRSVIGEFWIQLDVDEAAGYSLDLLYVGGRLIVREHHPQQYRTLYKATVGRLAGRGGCVAQITREDQAISVSFNGAAPVRVATQPRPRPEMGMTQIYITHAVRGTARAQGIALEFTAL